MKIILNILLTLFTGVCSAQVIPNLPIASGAGTAEVWRDAIYFFGGANTWSGRDQLYDRIYKFDGLTWSYHDSIPDGNVWDVESVLVGDDVYLIGGWPSGVSLLRKYNLPEGTWTNLRDSPNGTGWGITAEYLNGYIYLFNDRISVFEYDITSDTWRAKTPNNDVPAYLGLSSTVCQEEVYMVGFYEQRFYKYTPAADTWTRLADTPYKVAACAMTVIDDKIYCLGGSEQGSNREPHRTVLVYDMAGDSWAVDYLEIADGRTWMATAKYRGGFYILGGFTSTAEAVDTVEQIIPLGPVSSVIETVPSAFFLGQNYPNPFNPETTIPYTLRKSAEVKIGIFNAFGQQVRTFHLGAQPAGYHRVQWDGSDNSGKHLSSGVYVYRLDTGDLKQVRKMLLLR